MTARPAIEPAADADAKPAATPGRPKDLAKRAAILEAAKRLFVDGYERVSMDQIAAEAGVSKLTVYSHFGDKDSLFAEVVKSHCEQQLPTELFEFAPDMPLRDRLMEIAQAFFRMVSAPEAVAGHRIMCSPQIADSHLPQMFWEAGPARIHRAFAALLGRRVAAGELAVDDLDRAAGQFFTLLKGELHAQLVFGCGRADCSEASVHGHLEATVDMFLRAYAAPGHAQTR